MEKLGNREVIHTLFYKSTDSRGFLKPHPAPPKRNLGNISNRALDAEVEIGGG